MTRYLWTGTGYSMDTKYCLRIDRQFYLCFAGHLSRFKKCLVDIWRIRYSRSSGCLSSWKCKAYSVRNVFWFILRLSQVSWFIRIKYSYLDPRTYMSLKTIRNQFEVTGRGLRYWHQNGRLSNWKTCFFIIETYLQTSCALRYSFCNILLLSWSFWSGKLLSLTRWW